jgi:hypothetical protein
MPTEAFEIADSTDAAYNGGVTGARVKVGPFDSALSTQILDAVRDALVDAGWTQTDSTPAQAAFIFPYGPPVAIPLVPAAPSGATANRAIITINGLSFVMYDASRQLPGSDPNTVYVAMGSTVDGSTTNLANAIDSDSDFSVTTIDADGDYSRTINLEAKVAGTEYNSEAVHGGISELSGRPFFATPTTQPVNGGWVVRSTLASGEWLECWMYGSAATNSNRPSFEFRCSTGGATPTFNLDQLGAGSEIGFSIIANQFQFLIFQDTRDQAGSAAQSLFASQPWVKPGKGCSYAAIISRTTREALQFGGGGWSVARDGELSTVIALGNYNGAYPGFYVLGSPSADLTTSHGFYIISNAYIGSPEGLAADVGGQARIVGLAWDAIAMNRNAELDEVFEYRGRLWHCVFSVEAWVDYRTPASVWIAFDDSP